MTRASRHPPGSGRERLSIQKPRVPVLTGEQSRSDWLVERVARSAPLGSTPISAGGVAVVGAAAHPEQ
jgi:hypothetical protein